MRLAGNSEQGFVLTLSQRNVRELYHMMQLSNAQAVEGRTTDTLPMLFKAIGAAEQIVVQVETDDVHYAYREYPQALAISHDDPPPWDDADDGEDLHELGDAV